MPVQLLTIAGVLLALTACQSVQQAPSRSSASTAPPSATSATTTPTPTTTPTTTAAATTPTTTPATRVKTAPPDKRRASWLLATLSIKGRAPKTGYDRAQFGTPWTDANDAPLGHNGCDTRNDILRRDLRQIVTNGCTVLSGTLVDPYTATRIHFVRGRGTSSAVQIDHVVALSDAWQKGAQRWPANRREALANDPLNLLAVDGPTNQAKGDGDAATWLPPNKAYRCAYVARQIAVKARYALWVTRAEHDAMARVLSSCPGQRAPTESGVPPRVTPTSGHTTHAPAEVYYQNCAAVRAAGKAPLLRGQPGYRPALDRDGDGVACES